MRIVEIDTASSRRSLTTLASKLSLTFLFLENSEVFLLLAVYEQMVATTIESLKSNLGADAFQDSIINNAYSVAKNIRLFH
jgi:hypothetical protein